MERSLPAILAVPLTQNEYFPIFVWSFVTLAILGLGLLLVARVKRSLQQREHSATAGFTLSELRRMHEEGQLSDEELERAKAKVVEAARRALERDRQKQERDNAPLKPVDPGSMPVPPEDPKGPRVI